MSFKRRLSDAKPLLALLEEETKNETSDIRLTLGDNENDPGAAAATATRRTSISGVDVDLDDVGEGELVGFGDFGERVGEFRL